MELTFFEFRGQNLVCFGIAYNFKGKFAPEAGKAPMRAAFFTRVRRGILHVNTERSYKRQDTPPWSTLLASCAMVESQSNGRIT